MATLKTQQTEASVRGFLDSLEDEQRKKDCLDLLSLFKEVTEEPAKMWGESIIGYGSYHYKYKSGREGDWFLTGFSPRKQNLTIYIMAGFNQYRELLEKLGKHKTSSSCLYIKKLGDIDTKVLKELIRRSIEETRQRYS